MHNILEKSGMLNAQKIRTMRGFRTRFRGLQHLGLFPALRMYSLHVAYAFDADGCNRNDEQASILQFRIQNGVRRILEESYKILIQKEM